MTKYEAVAMRCEFHPDALQEHREGTLYYAERDPALGLRFVETVEDAIRRICEAPERWRILDEDVRRCLTRVFPYGILYTIHPYCRRDALQPRAGLLEASRWETVITSVAIPPLFNSILDSLMSLSGMVKIPPSSGEVKVRHAGERRHPGLFWFSSKTAWIPASAGMTD